MSKNLDPSFDSQHVRAMIARAYNSLEADEAIREIEEIWAELLVCSDMAEARVRLLLPRVEKPVLADTPEWLADQIIALVGQDCDQSAIESAEKLIRAVLHAVPDAPEADLSPSAFGAVEVSWGAGLHWLVYEPRLDWPGVNVRVFSGSPVFDHEPIHHAAGVIEHAKNALVKNLPAPDVEAP